MSSVEDERQSTEDSEKQLSDSGESPRQQTADDQDDDSSAFGTAVGPEKNREDLEKKRGKRADRKLRESALDDSGQFETKAPMESLANSLEYLQEILEQLNSLRVMMSQSQNDPTHASMNDKIDMDPGEITSSINQNWMAILSWVKEKELWRDCYNGSAESGTGILKHNPVNSTFYEDGVTTYKLLGASTVEGVLFRGAYLDQKNHGKHFDASPSTTPTNQRRISNWLKECR